MTQPSAHRDNAREDALTEAESTADGGSGASSGRRRGDVAVPALGPVGMLRWAWTQLTSMRTALMLLLLLAVAAVPGSLFPQRVQGQAAVERWLDDHPTAGPILDSLQVFDVYSSFWFSAIYLLLFTSLVGCIIPRAKKHLEQMSSPPPRTPRRLERLPQHGAVELDDDGPAPEQAVREAARVLKGRRYRVDVREASTDARGREVPASVGAEKGYLREIGNLLFHVSLVGVLICVAAGSMFSYSGQKIVTEDESFVNSLVSYDNFVPGTAFDESQMEPFSVTLDSFERIFDRENPSHYGQPLDFTADVTVREEPGAEPEEHELKVNHPLTFGGARVFLVGNGYAPEVTVRDGAGDVAYSGPVVARAQDSVYTSTVVIKAPDARPEQLSFVGLLLPTAQEGDSGAAVSVDPALQNPQLQLNSYAGDLGLDSGEPQNVYVLDTEGLTELNSRTSESGGLSLGVGETAELPDGLGSISFDGVTNYIGIDIHYNPGKTGVLIFALAALAGLILSLFLRRRRAWVTATTNEAGRTLVTYGLLARGEDFRLREETIALRSRFEKQWPVRAPEQAHHETPTDEQDGPGRRGRGASGREK
ncbi:cytochrome c biogenesis protein ResB [Nesterenkonia halophila]|uniref:cytochrome c biogenesis protein ResB n=1 Tax=Nesterenkonia halophila TaxID=302044 RepID=UPI0012914E33|nr:cytochrome c biogenesis protein ResB [Nesterenkonia halophila]